MTFGIIASLLLFFGSIFSGLLSEEISNTPLPAQPAATTTAQFPTAPVATTSTIKSSPAPIAQKPVAPPVPAPVTTPPVAQPLKSQEQINEETRSALVNILCLPRTGINGISGSGIIIDNRGVILTNAHIAQYFLLRNYLTPDNITCTVRVGSPAQERYTATLLYTPPAWVAANAAQLKAVQATGTGENDYAFLFITGRTDPAASLPATFSRMEMNRGLVGLGEEMLLASYPAGFLGSQTVQKNLYASSAVTYVTQLFSFGGNNNVELFSIGGTILSQGGSSGGAAVRLSDGKLAGIITTSTAGATTDARDLRAVSLAHIDDTLIAAGKGGIVGLLSGDLAAKAADFNTKIAPGLTAQLEAVLSGN